MSPTTTHRSVAFKLSLAALLSLLLVLLITMGIVSALLWQNFGRLSRGDAQQYAAQLRTLVQTFDETAQEQAKRDFTLFKANFPGNFSLSEAPGADGKPEATLAFQGVPINGDFEVVDRFSKDSMGAVATIFARTGDDLRSLVEYALRIRSLLGFVPRKYDPAVIEQMALAGAFDPALDSTGRMEALDRAARRLGMGDTEADWSVIRRDDGSIAFARRWRGVTDAHEIDAKFLDSAEARKLHRLAEEHAAAFAQPSRFSRTGAEVEPEPEATAEDEDEVATIGDSQARAAPVAFDGAITRPSQLLDAVLATGRKGLSISRYKGLGEMNAEQLWETTLDPENRALLQVKVEDADVTDEIFTRLMGDVVEPRREFIQENALNVANLDV